MLLSTGLVLKYGVCDYEENKVEDEELLDIYESLNKKLEISKKAKKRQVYYTLIIGVIIFFLSASFVIPTILDWYFEINLLYSYLVGLLFGLLLMVVSGYLGRPWPPNLSINEYEFFKVVESLNDIETYQKENIDFSRSEAVKKLSKVERQIKYQQTKYQQMVKNLFWNALMKENIDSLYQFKSNFKERLLPNLKRDNDEDLKKTIFIIEKFAKYLYNPTFSELKDLNKYMLEMDKYPPKESQLKTIFRHPYMKHLYVIIAIIGSCSVVSYVGIKMGVSIDTAYIVGSTLGGALIPTYLYLAVARKR